jgi:rod shape determining protein RodA
MGVALLTMLIASTYLAFVRIPWRAWLGVAALALVGLVTLWMFVFQPYQRSRILDVIDPGRDPLASGYQVIQSRIAVGSGGLLGEGYLEGTQTQLRFLPTQHTDFAFAVLAEEWGFLGSCLVLLNIGMVLGLAPVIGVPLPLFAYGGSALVSALIGLGLLMNVSMRRYVF